LLAKCLMDDHDKDTSRTLSLLELPFNQYEEESLRDFCINSEEHVAHDFIVLYYIHRGRYNEATDLYNLLRSKWNTYQANELDSLMVMVKRVLSLMEKPFHHTQIDKQQVKHTQDGKLQTF
jgi:hypothetical protein